MKLRFHLTALAAGFAFCVPAVALQVAQGSATPPTAAQESALPSISVGELQALIKGNNDIVILDVRDLAEYNQGHIPGAVLMPVDTIPDSYGTLPKTKQIVAYCKMGMRSEIAAKFLLSHGYTKVAVLKGGYPGWAAAQGQ